MRKQVPVRLDPETLQALKDLCWSKRKTIQKGRRHEAAGVIPRRLFYALVIKGVRWLHQWAPAGQLLSLVNHVAAGVALQEGRIVLPTRAEGRKGAFSSREEGHLGADNQPDRTSCYLHLNTLWVCFRFLLDADQIGKGAVRGSKLISA